MKVKSVGERLKEEMAQIELSVFLGREVSRDSVSDINLRIVLTDHPEDARARISQRGMRVNNQGIALLLRRIADGLEKTPDRVSNDDRSILSGTVLRES